MTKQNRDILYRLLRKKEDGTYEVVGFQRQSGGIISHQNWIGGTYRDVRYNRAINSPVYIPHDRIDQYTGVDVDGVKVFENDMLKFYGRGKMIDSWKIKIVFRRSMWIWVRYYDDDNDFSDSGSLFNLERFKIIGISGVTNEGVITK